MELKNGRVNKQSTQAHTGDQGLKQSKLQSITNFFKKGIDNKIMKNGENNEEQIVGNDTQQKWSLRPRKIENYKALIDCEPNIIKILNEESVSLNDQSKEDSYYHKYKNGNSSHMIFKDKKRIQKHKQKQQQKNIAYIDTIPNDERLLKKMQKEVQKSIQQLERQFFEGNDSDNEDQSLNVIQQTNKHYCIPLSVDVKWYNFEKLGLDQKQLSGGRLFDVIIMDPPWQLSSANPTRGVAIAYDTLNDREIMNIPFSLLQTDGFLFIWVINAKYRFAIQMLEDLGYQLIDEITWVKQTVNGKIAKGHGYYLQHAKETCLVGVKGNVDKKSQYNIEPDVIFSQRRGQSQKPEEIYDLAESLVPNGYYLEIFGRRNNLHNGWVTIGNEI